MLKKCYLTAVQTIGLAKSNGLRQHTQVAPKERRRQEKPPLNTVLHIPIHHPHRIVTMQERKKVFKIRIRIQDNLAGSTIKPTTLISNFQKTPFLHPPLNRTIYTDTDIDIDIDYSRDCYLPPLHLYAPKRLISTNLI